MDNSSAEPVDIAIFTLTSEPRKKNGLTFHYTACLIGVLIMVYYHPHVAG